MNALLTLPPLLTVYFDGRCALCAAEMHQIRQLDREHKIGFVDCSAADFDDPIARAAGLTRADLMEALHVRDLLGDWHRGVDAIALMYATAGAPWLARAWAHPLTRPLMRRLYPWVARHRRRLSALGLHLVAPRVLRLFARRHGPYAPPYCAHGDNRCRTPNP